MTRPRSVLARTAVVCLVASAPALVLAGCSSQKMVSKSELETQAQSALAESTGEEVPPITCPSDIEAKVGTTTTCTITGSSGGVFNVTLTITSVDEATNGVQFDVKVADQPNP